MCAASVRCCGLNRAMGRKSHHHQTPRLVLRRFAINGEVQMVRRDGKSKLVSIEAAAVGKDFYSYFRSDGTRDVEVENYLATHVESPAAPLIAALAQPAEPVQPNAASLARFLAFQIVRTPRFRDLDEQAHDRIGPLLAGFDAVQAKFGGENGSEWNPEEAERIRAEASANPPPEYVRDRTRNSGLRVMLGQVDALEAKLDTLLWAVAEADKPVFCTSDNPVVIFRPTRDPSGFHGIHPDAEAEVRFALDPWHLLLGSPHRLGAERFPVTDQQVTVTNQLIARECGLAYFHRPGMTPPGDLTLAPQAPGIPDPTLTMTKTGEKKDTSFMFPDQHDPALGQIVESIREADGDDLE